MFYRNISQRLMYHFKHLFCEKAGYSLYNTSRPRQISQKFVPKRLINNIPGSV